MGDGIRKKDIKENQFEGGQVTRLSPQQLHQLRNRHCRSVDAISAPAFEYPYRHRHPLGFRPQLWRRFDSASL